MSISLVGPMLFGGSSAGPNAAAPAALVDGASGPGTALELELMSLQMSIDAPGPGRVDLRV